VLIIFFMVRYAACEQCDRVKYHMLLYSLITCEQAPARRQPLLLMETISFTAFSAETGPSLAEANSAIRRPGVWLLFGPRQLTAAGCTGCRGYPVTFRGISLSVV